MEVHYFQRYHQKENVVTANTMLLLSRLYNYSANKFYEVMNVLLSDDGSKKIAPEFLLQENGKNSVPDAVFTQPGVKIVIETKLNKVDFRTDQLIGHLGNFKNEANKFLITLSPDLLSEKERKTIDEEIGNKNESVVHINTTFEKIAQEIQNVLKLSDILMQEVLDDYYKYCYEEALIVSRNKMKVFPTGKTYDLCKKENVYFRKYEKTPSFFDYIGLYDDKTVKAIGKVDTIITTPVSDSSESKYDCEKGEVTEDKKKAIDRIIEERKEAGEELDNISIRYYFVEKFYDTSFQKISEGGLWKAKIFCLTDELQIDESHQNDELPETEIIAEMLKGKTWE